MAAPLCVSRGRVASATTQVLGPFRVRVGGAVGATLLNAKRLLCRAAWAAHHRFMAPAAPPISDFLRRHAEAARRYAAEHFTDPGVTLDDFAAFYDISPRTARRCLSADGGPTWRLELRRLRMQRATELLSNAPSSYLIDDIAALCGYVSAPAFAKAFRNYSGLTPHEYRRGKGGPTRGGGPTGAFQHGARGGAERVDDTGWEPYAMGIATGRALRAGERAVMNEEIRNAELRLADQRVLTGGALGRHGDGWFAAVADEWQHPTRMRLNAAYWRQRRREFEAWVAANDRSSA